MVGTLCNVSDLRESRFGQPYPRHGLSLLWWFANVYLDNIDQNGRMCARYHPKHRSFGFHKFHNTERLLPHTHLTYYEVGNLSNRHYHPDVLPYAVNKNYDPDVPASNTDRIVASVDSFGNKVWFDKIYVTQHSDQTHFDQNRTYLISREIIKDIKNLTLEEFLRQMKNDQNSQIVQIEPTHESRQEYQGSNLNTGDDCALKCCCAIRFALLLAVILVIFAVILVYVLIKISV